MAKNQFQQGDILFVRVDLIPTRFRAKGLADHNVIAEGEVTGHKHLLVGDQVELLLGELEGDFAIHAPKGATVTHDEHKPIELPPGEYIGTTVQTVDLPSGRHIHASD